MTFLELFKTLTARVLSSLKILGLRPGIFKLDKTLLFTCFKHYLYCRVLCSSRPKRSTNRGHINYYVFKFIKTYAAVINEVVVIGCNLHRINYTFKVAPYSFT